MKKILIVVLIALFSSCSKSVEIGDYIKENSDLVFNSNANSLLGVIIYFDSYERVNNKLIFYNKNHKYVGEAFETESSCIGINMNKRVKE